MLIDRKFIPVWEYAKNNNVSRQTVYRWIREKKIPEDKFQKIIITKEKIFIDYNFKNK